MRMEIDIDEYDYKKVKELVTDGVFDYEGTTAHLYKAVANGRPVTHSHWIHHKGEHHEYVSCAKCGELAKCAEMADCVLWKYSKYCSDCGSIMDGDVEEVVEE